MNIHLCKGDETLEQALEYINEHDKEGKKYTFDKEKDRCYIGDEAFIGRFGGDEFCVITDEIDEDETRSKIVRLHDEISRLRKKNGWPKAVDISCGYRVYDCKSGVSAEDFQKQIDKLMYEEKQIHHSAFS